MSTQSTHSQSIGDLASTIIKESIHSKFTDCQILNKWLPKFVDAEKCCSYTGISKPSIEEANISISCDKDNRVISLSIANQEYYGEIDSTIATLDKLITLNLSHNLLNGSVPKDLKNLKNLKNLYLNDNKLTGAIPAEVLNMPSLEVLSLHNNFFSGVIPAITNGNSFTSCATGFNFSCCSLYDMGYVCLTKATDLPSNCIIGTIPDCEVEKPVKPAPGIPVDVSPSSVDSIASESEPSIHSLVIVCGVSVFLVCVLFGFATFSKFYRKRKSNVVGDNEKAESRMVTIPL